MLQTLFSYWPVALFLVERSLAIWASIHVILNKRDVRAVIGWVGLIWLSPFIGIVLYVLFGINRIHRHGGRVQDELDRAIRKINAKVPQATEQELEDAERQHPQMLQLVRLVGKITHRRLLPGNRVTPLRNGDAAYPAMLAAIDGAKETVTMMSYIFDNDRAGQEFIAALDRAHQRGVQVRVLVDDVGSRYTKPPAVSIIKQKGIPCKTFLPTRTPRSVAFGNLRNHRKIMVVDGCIGFTGGMNIREGCMMEWTTKQPTQDQHFRFDGPVVVHLQEAFAADWAFATGEILSGEPWFQPIASAGETWARGILDGPDEDFETLRLTILGAISVAQKRVVVMTPYFLPDISVESALNTAAMRGVQVDIVLPAENNLIVVHWAAMAKLSFLIERGCNVYFAAPPFDHSKLMLVDDMWSLVGSTNWDERSLRLNFEFNVECYDSELNETLYEMIRGRIDQGRRITLDELRQISLYHRLRNNVARLFEPYL